MTSLVIPSEEIEKLISITLDSFYFQKGVRINRSDIDYLFIEPRSEMRIGFQLKSIHGDQNQFFCVRVYIDFYESVPDYSEFRKEELQNTGTGPGDQVFVSIAKLPKAVFPTLSKVTEILSNPEGPLTLTLVVGDATLILQKTIGFVPQTYTIAVSSDVNVNVHLSSPADSTVMVNYATQNGTAIAGSDYKAISGVKTIGINDPIDSPLRIPLIGNRGYFNWFASRDNNFSSGTFDRYVQLLSQNQRLYSPQQGTGPGSDIALANQQIELASQYLEMKPRYYEFKLDSLSGPTQFGIQSVYKATAVDKRAPKYVNLNQLPAVFISFNLDLSPDIDLDIQATTGNEGGFSFHLPSALQDSQFPIRIHFLFDPVLGIKLGYNGNWFDRTNSNSQTNEPAFSTDPSTVVWLKPWFNGAVDLHQADRRFCFFLLASKGSWADPV